MADFAFHKSNHGDDEQVLTHPGHAHQLARGLRKWGHDARVEKSGDEHRVYINHPTDKSTVAYVAKGDVDRGGNVPSPSWIAKT